VLQKGEDSAQWNKLMSTVHTVHTVHTAILHKRKELYINHTAIISINYTTSGQRVKHDISRIGSISCNGPKEKEICCLCNLINHSQSEKWPSLWHAWFDLPCQWIMCCGEWHGTACTVNLHLNKSHLKPKRINTLKTWCEFKCVD